MRLIDCTYFTKGERIIQNAPATPTPIEQNQIAVKNTIDGFIVSLQDEFLCGMVGYTVMKLLLVYAETGAMEEGDDDYDAELSYLLDAVKEPFADFVMYRILRATITHATTTGTVQLQMVSLAWAPAGMPSTTTAFLPGVSITPVTPSKMS